MLDYAVLAVAAVLLALGYVLHVSVLITLGWIALAVGLVLACLAIAGRSVFRSRGRRTRL